jgi:hypothetical protein
LILRGAIALGVIIFLVSSLPRAWLWGQMQWVRKDDISQLDKVASAAIRTGELDHFQRWLTFRPKSESDILLEEVPGYASDVASITFFELANRAKYLGRTEDYVFWTLFGRFRLRYDLLRCGSPDSIEIMNSLFAALSPAEKTDDVNKVLADPAKTRLYLRKVLDFDARNPARNDPAAVCATLNKLQKGKYALVPKSEWAAIRHLLRDITERSLREMERSDPGTPG